MATTEEGISELLDRTRRLETRLVQLGDYVGANLRTKARIEVKDTLRAGAQPYVQVDALDVSVSRIATELRQHNVRNGRVAVYVGDAKEPAFAINLDACT